MLYSYSFAQNSAWTREYPGQEEILAYLVSVAQEYNLYQHVRFNSSVEEARWDEKELKWKTKVSVASGSKDAEFNPEYTITSDFLVSAVGQLNVPRWPDIPGVESFEGKKMHSARWDWSYDLKDKRIAMLGNGEYNLFLLPTLGIRRAYNAWCRLYLCPNRPRDRQGSQAYHNLPTNAQLDFPSTRHGGVAFHASRIQIHPTDPMEKEVCPDGFQRVFLRCCVGWQV